MANKNGLGKGLGALLNESDSSVSNNEVVQPKLPPEIEVREDGSLWIDPRLLKPNPKQPRVQFNQKQMDELADSIKVNGILQAIVIEHDEEDNTFYIIAGERRTRAAIMAGLDKVPVQLRTFSDEKKLEVALIENIQRTDLNPIEEANAYWNLIQIGNLSQEEVARRVGKSRSAVANSVRILRLPDYIQASLAVGEISAGHARALLMAKTPSDMSVMFNKIVSGGLSVREAEALAETYNNGGRASSTKTRKPKTYKDADVYNFEQSLRTLFGTPTVNFKGDVNKGSLVISFASQEDFERIYNVLMKLDPHNNNKEEEKKTEEVKEDSTIPPIEIEEENTDETKNEE